MKLALAGKGGVGKTSITAWMADYLARTGQNVWMIDADTALSLGQASGLDDSLLPEALANRKDLIQERIHAGGFLKLNPEVGDLPGSLAVDVPLMSAPDQAMPLGSKKMLVMGGLSNAGAGCACDANALLKALLAHMVMDDQDTVLVDLEAGVEYLGRGTVAHVDALVIVTEPSLRSLRTASDVGRMARELGLHRQILVVNRYQGGTLPELPDLPEQRAFIPPLPGLMERQMTTGCVLDLPESPQIDTIIADMLQQLGLHA